VAASTASRVDPRVARVAAISYPTVRGAAAGSPPGQGATGFRPWGMA
jgi:hypothetical protein